MEKVHLNETEMLLLAYFHEHARRHDKYGAIYAEKACPDLGIEQAQWVKACSFLAGWHLLAEYPESLSVGVYAYYLTSLGENYMRSLEAGLVESDEVEVQEGETLTTGLFKKLWAEGKDALTDIAAKTLAEYLRG